MATTAKKRVLLVDDNASYRQSLSTLLHLEDYQVTQADSVESARKHLPTAHFDIVLTDLRLKDHADEYDISGLEVAKTAKEHNIPCVVVTAFPTVEAALTALRSRGAEPLALDLVPKRYGPRAVLDAIEACVNNLDQDEKRRGLWFDTANQMFRLDGEELHLSDLQYKLLDYLHHHTPAVCSRQALHRHLYEEILSPNDISADRRLEGVVERLRDKIEDDPSEPRYLITEHGRGLRLVLDAEVSPSRP
jgi:DNA-binding response OmpR family regulator